MPICRRTEEFRLRSTLARRSADNRIVLVSRPVGAPAIQDDGNPETLEELARHSHVRFSWTSAGEHLTLIGPGGPVTIGVRSVFLANNSFILVEAIRSGLGVGGVQVPLVHELLAKGELVRVMQDYAYPPMDLHAAYPSRRFIPRKVRALVDRLVAGPQVPGLEMPPRLAESQP